MQDSFEGQSCQCRSHGPEPQQFIANANAAIPSAEFAEGKPYIAQVHDTNVLASTIATHLEAEFYTLKSES